MVLNILARRRRADTPAVDVATPDTEQVQPELAADTADADLSLDEQLTRIELAIVETNKLALGAALDGDGPRQEAALIQQAALIGKRDRLRAKKAEAERRDAEVTLRAQAAELMRDVPAAYGAAVRDYKAAAGKIPGLVAELRACLDTADGAPARLQALYANSEARRKSLLDHAQHLGIQLHVPAAPPPPKLDQVVVNWDAADIVIGSLCGRMMAIAGRIPTALLQLRGSQREHRD